MPNPEDMNSHLVIPYPGKSTETKWYSSDDQFNRLYPMPIQQLSGRHWTPLGVSEKAAAFLVAGENVRVLDIGSGVGKFCLGAAHYQPGAYFTGVEQRHSLVLHADNALDRLSLPNVNFIHGNFTQLDLTVYDHFYFFNSFYENLASTDKIDNSIDYSGELYNYYARYLFKALEQMPAGTRLATFHSLEDEIPPGYEVVRSEMDNLLKFWIKL
jgi:SAM-dependent methyltransferase